MSDTEIEKTENGAAEATETADREAAIAEFLRSTAGEYPEVRVGPGLRTLREALGIQIETIAAETRLRKDYLLGMEEMTTKLPATFLKLYLGAYARFVGVDANELVKRYEQQFGALSHAGEVQIDTTPREKSEKKTRSLMILGAGSALAVVSIAALAFVFTGGGSRETLAEDRVAELEPLETTTNRPNFAAEELASVDARKALDFELVAIKRGWLEVRGADGTIFRSRNMSAGETFAPRVDAGWTVTVRDGSAFAWQLDGELVGTLGENETPVYAASVDAAAKAAVEKTQTLTAAVPQDPRTR